MHVDLNADMGESFGPWPMGSDAELLKVITSANVACGFHAGDWDVMSETMSLAVANDVGIGAHPGFPDLQGFGRRRMQLSHDSLRNLVRYQLGAAQAMARSVGGTVRHLKLHGALANMASEDAWVRVFELYDLRDDKLLVWSADYKSGQEFVREINNLNVIVDHNTGQRALGCIKHAIVV